MWKIDLHTIDKCQAVADLCNTFKDIDIDLVYGRYLVDAKSLMGVLSLLNHSVGIVIHHHDRFDCLRHFESEIKKLGAWREARNEG